MFCTYWRAEYTYIKKVYKYKFVEYIFLFSVHVTLDLDIFVRMSAEFLEAIRARTTQVGHYYYYWTFDLELCHASFCLLKLKSITKFPAHFSYNNYKKRMTKNEVIQVII